MFYPGQRKRSEHRTEESLRRILIPLGAAGLLAVTGAFGYRSIEGWDWSDSLYMVFITLSTVGFSEVHDLSAAGRLWTMFLVVGGITLIGSTAARAIEFFTEGSLYGYRRQRRMEKKISALSGHYVVCGYGRVGQKVVEHFLAAGQSIVVIDREDREGLIEDSELPHVFGNAENEAVLEQAGIKRAKGLVSAVDSDTENVFITLTARQLNPQLRVIARASNEETARKLKLVGAERVVSPYVASGRRMAHLALRPHAVDFFDELSDPLKELNVEVHELQIADDSALAGRSLREIDLCRSTGVIIVALRKGEAIQLNPDPDAVLDPGSHLLAMGTVEQCAKLQEMNAKA